MARNVDPHKNRPDRNRQNLDVNDGRRWPGVWRDAVTGGEEGGALLAVKLWLARAVLVLERLAVAFWPLFAWLGLFAALVLFDFFPLLGLWLHIIALVVVVVVAGILAWRGARGFAMPGETEARRRLERASGLVHRPIETLEDNLAAGRDSRAIAGLWELHRRRLRAQIHGLRIGWPDFGLARHDPYALRTLVIFLLFVAVSFGAGDWRDRIARALAPDLPKSAVRPTTMDAWINPPAYTKLAPIFLKAGTNDLLAVPTGSAFLAQVQGAKKPWVEIDKGRYPFEVIAEGSFKVQHEIVGGDRLAVRHEDGDLGEWRLDVLPDLPPTVIFPEAPGRSERLALRLPYAAEDDYGLVSLAALVRRADKPELEPLVLEVILPARTGKDALGDSYHDLTPHPWAGLAVDIELVARDAIDQEGRSEVVRVVLPERIFNHPVARALVEQRRQLSIDPDDRMPVIRALDDISGRPDHFFNDTTVALSLYSAVRRLLHDRGADAVPSVQELLWDTALRIEEGELAIAERDLREIQKALMEALSEDADASEIESLIDQLEAALDSFLEALGDKMREEMTEAEENERFPSEMIDSQQLRDMIEKARQMARNGDKDAAQEMLAQLQQMLENLRAEPFAENMMSEEAQQAQQMMRDLEDMMSQQQDLLDRNFGREREQRSGSSGQDQERYRKESDRDAGAQESLRRKLGELMRQMGQMLDDIPGPLGESEQQMRNARDSLRAGRSADAIDPQRRSLDFLQQGMESMAERFMEMFGQQSRGSGSMANRPGAGAGRDPLGRGTGDGRREATEGVMLPQEMELRRSREILDELRRRRGDRNRPKRELDYIDRLLRQF